MIKFLKYKRIYYAISLALILASVASIGIFGLNLGIEFTGGSIMEIEYEKERPSTEEVRALLADINLGEIVVQPAGEKNFIIRMGDVSREEYEAIRGALVGTIEHRFESIGPVIGEELRGRALISVFLALLAIVIYIALMFSGTGGKSVKSWQYGIVAAGIVFLHDTLIVLGSFALFGHFFGAQITIAIVVALLIVIGYSINDTVVIFDRVRENGIKNPKMEFSEIIDKSLNQTLGRSISTSLTTLFVLVAIFFFGGETLRWFALAIIMGISIGSYSSIFLGGPLLASWFYFNQKIIKK